MEDADVDGPEAWEKETGESWVKIGIVDSGVQTNHPDFTGRVTGDFTDPDIHGTAVAGMAAAQGNNIPQGQSIGVVGMAWNALIINEDYEDGSIDELVESLNSARYLGAHIINNSWKLTPEGTYSVDIRKAPRDAYRVGRTAVASTGNRGWNVAQYPAAHQQGVISVGATSNTDARAGYSNWGSWIDVVAPGGDHIQLVRGATSIQ